jgi:hypothetical protein
VSLTFNATLKCDRCSTELPVSVEVVLDKRQIPELKIQNIPFSWDLEGYSPYGGDEREHRCPKCKYK